MSASFLLRAGDLVVLDGQPCRVVRVTDSSAVVAVKKAPRELVTRFDVRMRIQPKPALVRISPNLKSQILNRA